MMIRLYDMRELVKGIQYPYWPWHPDYSEDGPPVYLQRLWSMAEALRQLQECPSDQWRDAVLNSLRQIDYRVPGYIQHPLIDYLIDQKAITRRDIDDE